MVNTTTRCLACCATLPDGNKDRKDYCGECSYLNKKLGEGSLAELNDFFERKLLSMLDDYRVQYAIRDIISTREQELERNSY
jgi:hypothetical protein